ncbi:MAG: hypothetical protein NC217_03675 [Muribaculaceae bacterium]|nr:hypothetical protein [Muribaculaceae bacterium]
MKFGLYLLGGALLVGMGAALAAPTAEDELSAGMAAMMQYDFASARTHLNKYKELARKEGLPLSKRADDALAAIPLAEDMLAGQVEQIVILDSISTAIPYYINAYSLSGPAGHLFIPEDLKDMGGKWTEMTPFGPIYESEDGTVRYVGVESTYTDEDSGEPISISRLYEGVKLDNGVWTDPVALFDEDVDAAFPYMMSDGCTFYFASRTEEGLGGWDIFRSYRDSDDGTFRNPVNMGMPYNSPGDDYMLAVDEYAGVGQWTTERHEQTSDTGEPLTVVYRYIPSEMRKNYDADTPEIKELAALWTLHSQQDAPVDIDDDVKQDSAENRKFVPGYKLTWPDGADYSALFETLDAIREGNKQRVALSEDFTFEGPGGKIYTRYDQLPRQARHLMQKYQEALEHQQSGEKELANLRANYRELPSDSVRRAIELQQGQVDELRRKTRSARNDLFEALK